MIIQLRGTSGTGKTTAMRKIMDSLGPELEEVYTDGRRKPAYYLGRESTVAVLGHYENVCGGCDTFKNYEQLHAALRAAFSATGCVLMEGLMLSDDVLQTVKMHKEVANVRCLYLHLDVETCIERVKQRRKERGQGEEFNFDKLRNRQAQIDRTRSRLEVEGILCRRAAPNQVPGIVLRLVEEANR